MPSQTKAVGSVGGDGSSGGVVHWGTEANVLASDDQRCSTALLAAGDQTWYLVCTNFGFSVPGGATIAGIEAKIEWASISGYARARQWRCRIVKGGVISSNTGQDATTSLPSSDTVTTKGSSSYLWGTTWTSTDVNASDFGVAIACQGPLLFNSGSADVDYVEMVVHWTTSSPTIVAATADATARAPVASPTADGRFVEVALTPHDPVQAGDWAKVTSEVRVMSMRRGRPFNLDRVEAGTGELTLNNGDGRWDPANTLSPLYPNVLPLRPVRSSFVRSGVRYNRFRGRIERFEPEWAGPNWQFMHVQLADEFERLANTMIVSDYATLTTALTGTNNDLTFTALEPGREDITVEYVVAGTNTPLDTGTNEPVSTGSFRAEAHVPWDSIGHLFRGGLSAFRAPRPVEPTPVTLTGTSIQVQVATNSGGSATSTANDVKAGLEANTDVMKLITVALAPGNTGAGVVTALAQTPLTGSAWPQELTGARINRVLDSIGYTGDRQIDDGIYEVVAQSFAPSQNVSALAHMQEVADSELGYVFIDGGGVIVYHDGGHRARDDRSTASQATFTDDDTGFRYRDLELVSLEKDRIANHVTVTTAVEGSQAQEAEDATSIGVYRERNLSRQTQLANPEDALAQAIGILAAFKDPHTRFDSITLLDDSSSNYALGVFAREIGDRVTVRTNPPVSDVPAVANRWTFESATGDGGWYGNFYPSGSFAAAVVDDTSFGSAKALEFSGTGGTGTGGLYCWPNVPWVHVLPDQRSTVTAKMKLVSQTGASRMGLWLQWSDISGTPISSVTDLIVSPTAGVVYELSATGTAPPNAWYAVPLLGIESPTAAVFRIDDVVESVYPMPYTIEYDCYIEAVEDVVPTGLNVPIQTTFRLSVADQSVSVPEPPPVTGNLKDSSGDDFTLDSATKGRLG